MNHTSPIYTALFILLLMLPAPEGLAGQTGMSLTANAPWKTNHMTQNGPNSYEITGSDPYVISPNLNRPLKRVSGIFFELVVDGNVENSMLQLFWETNYQGFGEVFSFRFATPEQERIFIPFQFYETQTGFPEDTVLKSIRLDLDGCERCILRIRRAEMIEKATPELLNQIPVNMIYPVMPKPVAQNMTTKGSWRLMDIEWEQEGTYRIVGDDPHMYSPDLDVLFSTIKGAHFRLKLPQQTGKVMMQLFWSSYRLKIDENRSVWFLAEVEDGIADVYVPFYSFLQDDLLKTIRLDVRTPKGSVFQIESARLVASPDETLIQRTPKHIMHSFGSGLSIRQIVSDMLHRLAVDKVFMGLYLLLLLAVSGCWVWIRKYRAGQIASTGGKEI